ncbi:hypothetical protein E5288_WYG014186 [Bos mutus]|uniref:Uncharacterized protein n=1 Tax=Bos mutus TaxID=72004 RepID=A0A6B0R8Z9_9CETA|nr:hypothetical protein [Bos mutus]
MYVTEDSRLVAAAPRSHQVCGANSRGINARQAPKDSRTAPRPSRDATPSDGRSPAARALPGPSPGGRRCLPGRGGDHGGGGLCKVPKPARQLRERGARTRPAAPSSREPRAPRAREAGAAGRASRDPHANR